MSNTRAIEYLKLLSSAKTITDAEITKYLPYKDEISAALLASSDKDELFKNVFVRRDTPLSLFFYKKRGMKETSIFRGNLNKLFLAYVDDCVEKYKTNQLNNLFDQLKDVFLGTINANTYTSLTGLVRRAKHNEVWIEFFWTFVEKFAAAPNTDINSFNSMVTNARNLMSSDKYYDGKDEDLTRLVGVLTLLVSRNAEKLQLDHYLEPDFLRSIFQEDLWSSNSSENRVKRIGSYIQFLTKSLNGRTVNSIEDVFLRDENLKINNGGFFSTLQDATMDEAIKAEFASESTIIKAAETLSKKIESIRHTLGTCRTIHTRLKIDASRPTPIMARTTAITRKEFAALDFLPDYFLSDSDDESLQSKSLPKMFSSS